MKKTFKIESVLEAAIKENVSDVHFTSNEIPYIRVNRRLICLNEVGIITTEELEDFLFSILLDDMRENLYKERSLDFSYTFKKGHRFRVNAFFESGRLCCALRYIPSEIKSIEELNLPESLHKISQATQGFVLVTGPTGHGKSTTLASIIQEINIKRSEHIITIENPIEYIFKDGQSLIHQREVGVDTPSFNRALKDALREDPNVIMVGEMRDLETMATAITAAETGHLVLSTLHTNSAAETIHRIVDSFPPHQQNQVRLQLASSLLAIISQRLLPSLNGGLIPAVEILFKNAAVSNLIRENKIHEVHNIMESSIKEGMISLNRYLVKLVKEGKISQEVAFVFSNDPQELKLFLS
ncbi:Twitching mobility protein [bacterium HR34]|nr:Twitching mobility protein [bacterium HR34]